MKAQIYNQVFRMLVSKSIPQLDPRVKIGSAKVFAKEDAKGLHFFAKVGQIPEKEF